MVVPWAHGLHVDQRLQRIVLTNEYRAMDTYRAATTVESYLRTARTSMATDMNVRAGQAVTRPHVMVGLPGLKRGEY